MPKLIVEGRELEKGDWIVVEGDGWEEIGSVVDIDEDEINMYDGKEGWTVDRSEIKKIYFKKLEWICRSGIIIRLQPQVGQKELRYNNSRKQLNRT